jgi:hypothetical protein
LFVVKIILPLRYVEENREKELTRYPVANVRVLKELFLQIGASKRFPVGRVLHVTMASTKNDEILIFFSIHLNRNNITGGKRHIMLWPRHINK